MVRAYASLQGYPVERCAQIKHLHEFGCDGRPYRHEDKVGNDSGHGLAHKLLCEHGAYFLKQARRNGKKGLLLIENHTMTERDVELMDKRMPEVLDLQPDHLIYYFYPRGLKDPDKAMATLARHIRKR